MSTPDKRDRKRSTKSDLKSRLENIRHTRRILAPYLKGRRIIFQPQEENKYFQYYAEKKPSILLQVMTKWSIAVDLKDTLMETISALKYATKSRDGIVFLMDDNLEEIFYMTQDTSFETELKVSYKIQPGTTVPAYVAYAKKCVKIDDLLEDTRFPYGLGNIDVEVNSVICVPVITPEDEVLAVFLLYRIINDYEYIDDDFYLVITMASWVGSTLYQHQLQCTLKKQQELIIYLLNLIQVYFHDTTIFDKLMADILTLATVSIDADHSAIYILQKNNTIKFSEEENEIFAIMYEKGAKFAADETTYKQKISIDMNDETSTLRRIIIQKKTVNMRDCIKDEFVSANALRHKKEHKIRSLLAIPIKCANDILGILMVTNKRKVSMFLKHDEILLNTFAEHCGLVLKYARVHSQKSHFECLNATYSDMLNYHVQPCVHDKFAYESRSEYLTLPSRFQNFDFYYSGEAVNDLLPDLAAHILNETVGDLFTSNNEIMIFVLTVRKFCKKHPYHNFQHAFHALHCVYNILRLVSLPFTRIQIQGMIIGSLCLCVSHPATSTSMIRKQGHFLYELFDENNDVVENHLFEVAEFIIKKNKLFRHLTEEVYVELIQQIKFSIIATSVSVFMYRKRDITKLYKTGAFNFNDPYHKDLLISNIMAMSSFADLCKPFTVTRYLITQMYEEQYIEGDYYKEIGVCPTKYYNRDDNSFIEEDQIEFMTLVVIPCALALYKLCSVEPLYRDACMVKDHWVEIKESRGQRMWTVADSHPHKFTIELEPRQSQVPFDD